MDTNAPPKSIFKKAATISVWISISLFVFLFAAMPVGKANNTIPTILVDATSNRYEVSLEEERTTIELCDLIIDQTYTLSYATDHAQAIAITLSEGTNKKAFKTNQKIHFKSSSNCALLYFEKPGKESTIGTLSIGIAAIPKAASRSNGAGIKTDENPTSEQLVKDIFIGGDCFEVRNIKYSGDKNAIGSFEDGKESLDIERGVILSTGDIANAHGPNISTRISTDFSDYHPSDKDLEALLSSKTVTLEDAAILEFDFTPTTNRIQFQYSFASEEYCDYVGSKFNDVFGFFLSGPGIKGTFENEAVNIASVPGTTDFVAINNINHLTNKDFFVNNVPEGQIQFVPCDNFPDEPGVATELIEFDGFTTVLTAVAEVMPCQTYHIKLAIADASDALFDSAVFLKANSFNAGGAAYVKRILPDVESREAYEGCKESYFLFERTDQEALDSLVVHFNVSNQSTAVAGLDYAPFPDSVIILPGDRQKLLPIVLYSDNIIEGTEHLIMELESACSCADLSIDLPINDFIPLTAASQTDSICGSQEININPKIAGGVGALEYKWSTGDTSDMLQVLAKTSATYGVTATDVCDNTITAINHIEVLEAPMVDLEADKTVCDLEAPVFFNLNFSGLGPWTIAYTINDLLQPLLTTKDPSFPLPAKEEGIYAIQSIRNNNCSINVQKQSILTVTKPESAAIQVAQPICEGESGSIDILEVRGGSIPYSYSLDNGRSFGENPFFDEIEPGFHRLLIQDINNCQWSADYEIEAPAALDIALEKRVRLTLGDRYQLDATISKPLDQISHIEWFPAENLTCPNCLSTEVVPLKNTTYEISVTDERGCTKKASVDLIVLKDYKVFVPSAFSPNGDGNNDLFYINADNDQILSIRQFQVINRWGDLLYQATNFQPNDPQYSWDGTYNGQPLNAQVLAYFVEMEFINGEVVVFKGDVTLVDR